MAGSDVAAREDGPDVPGTSVYVWGADRSAVNRAAQELVRRLGPRHVWLEAGDPANEGARSRRSASGGQTLAPRELVPSSSISDSELRSSLRPGDGRAVAAEERQFRALPEAVRAATVELRGRPGPRVLVIANADRLSPFDPDRRGLYGALVDYFTGLGITLIVTVTGHPLPDRSQFEYSVTPVASLPERYRSGIAVCQWGDCEDCLIKLHFPDRELACLGEISAAGPRASPEEKWKSGVAAHGTL